MLLTEVLSSDIDDALSPPNRLAKCKCTHGRIRTKETLRNSEHLVHWQYRIANIAETENAIRLHVSARRFWTGQLALQFTFKPRVTSAKRFLQGDSLQIKPEPVMQL